MGRTQARRASAGEIRRAHARRERRAARHHRQPVTAGDVIGYAVMTLFTAYFIGAAFGWWIGIDSWEIWK